MSCKKIEELLPLHAAGELAAEDRSLVQAHLAGCPACSGLLDALRQAEAALSSFPELEVGPALLARLQAISTSRKPRHWAVPAFFLNPSYQSLAAVVFLAVALGSWLLLSPAGGRFLKSLDRRVHVGYSQLEKLYAKAESAADSLNATKNEVIVSLKNISPLGRDDRE